MLISERKLPGTFEISLGARHDSRGYFARVFDVDIFREAGLQISWVQENQSLSLAKHTVRGLHFQLPPFAETKLVRVISGAVLDVFVDLRKDSPSFGQWDAIELSAENLKMVYLPRGFAHGFCTLTDNTVVTYKVDCAYAPDYEGGIRWDDRQLNINWPTTNPILSERDGKLPLLSEFDSPFVRD